MSYFASLNGALVNEATLTVPLVGCPTARVKVASQIAVPPKSTLVIGGITMVCTPVRQVLPFQGNTDVFLVGGAGGWGREVAADGYQSDGGVRLSTVLRDLALVIGETLVVDEDRTLGNWYSRERARAGRHLVSLCPDYRVDFDGTTHTGPRASSVVPSTFTVLDFDGPDSRFTIATDHPEDWLPGRTFRGPTFAGQPTIGGVVHSLAGASVRTEVYVQ